MRADRLLSILLLLQAHGKVTTAELAEKAGVSRRTILRDLNALSSAGVPVTTESGPGGGVALDAKYQVALSGLSATDLPALFVSGMPSLLGSVGMEQRAEEILLKLFAALPHYHQQAVLEIRHRLHVDPQWWWYEEEPLPFWEELQRAVFEDRKVRARYERHDGSMSERTLDPYALVSKAGIWYVVARHDDLWRTYRTARFHQVTVLAERFRRAEDFDLAHYWRGQVDEMRAHLPTYAFTVRMPEALVDFLRYNISGNSTIVELPDIPEWYRARVHVPSREAAMMLLFGLGAQAEILEPEELRAAVIMQAAAIAAAHGVTRSSEAV